MTPPQSPQISTRTPLTKERVLTGAMELADQIGIESFTIRKLAAVLDVKPMTIYQLQLWTIISKALTMKQSKLMQETKYQ